MSIAPIFGRTVSKPDQSKVVTIHMNQFFLTTTYSK